MRSDEKEIQWGSTTVMGESGGFNGRSDSWPSQNPNNSDFITRKVCLSPAWRRGERMWKAGPGVEHINSLSHLGTPAAREAENLVSSWAAMCQLKLWEGRYLLLKEGKNGSKRTVTGPAWGRATNDQKDQ